MSCGRLDLPAVERELVRSHGNVSAAAKALGIPTHDLMFVIRFAQSQRHWSGHLHGLQRARTASPAAETTTSASTEQEPAPEFAPESITQLIGAWASSEADCARLFQRRGKAVAYRQPVDKFAEAVIVGSQRIRLPSAVCQVESASQEGGALRLNAECHDFISYTSRTVHVKQRSDSELFYSPTGDPVLATTLIKCPL